MFCENCGRELTDDIRFCPECGTEIRIPYPDRKSPKTNIQDFRFVKNEKPFVSKQKVTTEKKNIFASQASRLGYHYNLGHFCTFWGAVLEILSLFLPNKTEMLVILDKNGITMWDFLKTLLQHILEDFLDSLEEKTWVYYFILIYYFAILFVSCIQLNTDLLLMTAILNIAMVGYTVYQFNEYFANYINRIDAFFDGNNPVQGMGYWLFLASGIMILVSAVIAKMLSINEKSKASNKTI